MGFLDKLFGSNPDEEYRRTTERVRAASAARSDDEVAVERYRYLLRTAPPETIQQVHEEAFTKLTPEQRRMVFNELVKDAPAGEAPSADDPRSLAVSATRSEMRHPGTLERSFGNVAAAGPGFGSMFASSMLGNIAGYFIASSLMSAFMPMDFGSGTEAVTGSDTDSNGDGSPDVTDQGTDGSIDAAGDPGDFGGDGFDGGGFDGGDFGDFGF